MIVGYVRVSTKEQNVDLQLDSLKGVGVEKIFIDKISSVKERPELESLLNFVRSGDTVVVYKLDRIARSLKHLISIVECFKTKGVSFVSVTENIDTSTYLGEFFLHITGAFAELERNLVIERTKAGLISARARGKVGGRKKGLSADSLKKAEASKRLYETSNNEMTVDEMCQVLRIGKATFYRYLKFMDVTLKRDR